MPGSLYNLKYLKLNVDLSIKILRYLELKNEIRP